MTFTATVQSGQCPSPQSGFPAFVNLNLIPEPFWTTVRTDGGDIRVYEDVGLTNLVPREVISFNKVAETGTVFLRATTISNGYQVWITVDGTSPEPAASSLYGADAVWVDYDENNLSADWITTENNNQNNPAAFWGSWTYLASVGYVTSIQLPGEQYTGTKKTVNTQIGGTI